MAECFCGAIRECKVSEGEFRHPEARGSRALFPRTDSLSEKRELESKFPSLIVGKGSRGIPPLRLELPVRSMISGKNVFPTRLRGTPFHGMRTLCGDKAAGENQC